MQHSSNSWNRWKRSFAGRKGAGTRYLSFHHKMLTTGLTGVARLSKNWPSWTITITREKKEGRKKQDDDLVKLSTHNITAPGCNLAASSLISFLGIRARSVVRNPHLPPCRRPDKRRGYDQGGTDASDSNNNNVNEIELSNLLMSIQNHALPWYSNPSHLRHSVFLPRPSQPNRRKMSCKPICRPPPHMYNKKCLRPGENNRYLFKTD